MEKRKRMGEEGEDGEEEGEEGEEDGVGSGPLEELTRYFYLLPHSTYKS